MGGQSPDDARGMKKSGRKLRPPDRNFGTPPFGGRYAQTPLAFANSLALSRLARCSGVRLTLCDSRPADMPYDEHSTVTRMSGESTPCGLVSESDPFNL